MESDEQRLQRIRLAKERIMQKKANQGRTDGSGGPQASIPPSRQRTQPPSRQPSQPPTRRPSQQQIYHNQAPPPQQYHQQHQQYNGRRPSQASAQQQQLPPTGRSPHPPPSPAVKPATTPKSAQPLPSPAKTPPEETSAQSDVRGVPGQSESLQMPPPPQSGFVAPAGSRTRASETPPRPHPPQSGFEASALRGRAGETPPLPPLSQRGFEASASRVQSTVTSPFAFSSQQSMEHFATDYAPHEEIARFPSSPQQSVEASASSSIVPNETAVLPPPPQSGFGASARPPTSNENKSLPPPPQTGFGASAPPTTSKETAALSPPPQSGFGASSPPVSSNEKQSLPPPPQSGFVAPPQGGFVPRASFDGQSKIPPRGGFVPRTSFDATATRSRYDESHHARHRFHDINAQPEQGERPQSAERVEQPAEQQPSPRSKEQPAAAALSATAVVNNPRAFLGGIFSSVVETLATGSDVVASGIEQALRKTPALANHNPSAAANAKRQGAAATPGSEREATPAQDFSYEQFAGGASGEPNAFDSVSLNNPSSAISADFSEVPLAGGQIAGFSRPNDGFDAVLFEDQSFSATPPPPLAAARPDSVLDDLLPATLQAEQDTERPLPIKVASGVDLSSTNAGSPWLESSVYSDGNPVVVADEVAAAPAPEPASEWLPAQPAPAIFGARPPSSARASPYANATNMQAGSSSAGGARQAATNDTPQYGSFDDATFEVGPDFIPDALPSDVHESRISPTPASEIKPGTPIFSATGVGPGRPVRQSDINMNSSPAATSVASAAQTAATPYYAGDTVASAFAPVQSFDFGPSAYGAQDFVITNEDSQLPASDVFNLQQGPQGQVPPHDAHEQHGHDPVANAFSAQATPGTAYGAQPGYGSPQHADTGSYASYTTRDADPVANAFGGSYSSYGQEADPVANAFGAQQNVDTSYGSYGQDANLGESFGSFGHDVDSVANASGQSQNAESYDLYGQDVNAVANAFGGQSAPADSYAYYGQDPVVNAFGGQQNLDASNDVGAQQNAAAGEESYGSYGQDVDPVAKILGAQQDADAAADPVVNAFGMQSTPGEFYSSYGQDAHPVASALAQGPEPSADAAVDPVTNAFGMLSVSGYGQDSVTSAFGSQPNAYATDMAQGSYGQDAGPVTSAFGTQPRGQDADSVTNTFGFYGQEADPGSNAFGSQPSADATQGLYDQEADPLTQAFGPPSNDDPIANASSFASSPASARQVDPIANAFSIPATPSSSHGAYGQQFDSIANAFGTSSTPASVHSVYSQHADPVANAFGLSSSPAGSHSTYSQQAHPVSSAFGSQASPYPPRETSDQHADPITNAFGPQSTPPSYEQHSDPIASAFSPQGFGTSVHGAQDFVITSDDPPPVQTQTTAADASSSSAATVNFGHSQASQPLVDSVADAFGPQLSHYFGTSSYGSHVFAITSDDPQADAAPLGGNAFNASPYGQHDFAITSDDSVPQRSDAQPPADFFNTGSYGTHDFNITSDDLPAAQETAAYGMPTSEPAQYGASEEVAQQPAQTPLEAFSLSPSEYPVAPQSDSQGAKSPFVSGTAQQDAAPSQAPRYDPKELDDIMRANDALRSRFAQMMARLPASLLATAAH
ncbi:hypothetical protein HDU87_005767 [Geranomyces variabilis]|uniref:Uncharacterized protein n=1 Tax=Geranomyces variabilis TaxID=109894 RepID=A0AAD5TGM9_9FUNG|nr:hypothetical protein HDU87_005767 [Geranomyces variabilis]